MFQTYNEVERASRGVWTSKSGIRFEIKPQRRNSSYSRAIKSRLYVNLDDFDWPQLDPSPVWDGNGEEGASHFKQAKKIVRDEFFPVIRSIFGLPRDAKIRYSQNAGCNQCPCSPGFIIDDARYSVDVNIKTVGTTIGHTVRDEYKWQSYADGDRHTTFLGVEVKCNDCAFSMHTKGGHAARKAGYAHRRATA